MVSRISNSSASKRSFEVVELACRCSAQRVAFVSNPNLRHWDERQGHVGWDNDEDHSLGRQGGAMQCPYCWEFVTPPLEEDLEGDLVWDCEICCRPWLIRITVDYEGQQSFTVERAQN